MQLKDIKLYRITHIENIPHILEHGITHRSSINANPNFVKIGDLQLIDVRSDKTIRINNGILDAEDQIEIRLGDFIPFHFGVRMPMLYTIQKGGNFVESAVQPEDIIYVVCALDKIIEGGLDFYFSDGHATNDFTFFYDKSQVTRMPTLIDWHCITRKYWGGDDNLNVKRKKQAEVLVGQDIPINMIIGYGCYNDTAMARLIAMGADQNKIKIIPDSYY